MRTKLISNAILATACAINPGAFLHAQTPPNRAANAQSAQTPAAQRENYDPLLDLPPLPNNKVTLLGGTVVGLDEVMNHMIFQPFGDKKRVAVSFDTRTHFYRDGQPISYREIKQGQRVYVDTMLNGSKVFAKSIWIQGVAVSGLGRGQIVEFDQARNTLTVRDELSSQSVKMKLTPGTVIRSSDKPASRTDLVPGALVSLRFGPNRELQEVTLSAKPGSEFTFAGRVTYLDLSRKIIAIDNQSDRSKYDISIEAVPVNVVRQLHEGDNVSVVAVFDGSRYEARRVELPPGSGPQQ